MPGIRNQLFAAIELRGPCRLPNLRFFIAWLDTMSATAFGLFDRSDVNAVQPVAGLRRLEGRLGHHDREVSRARFAVVSCVSIVMHLSKNSSHKVKLPTF